MFRYSSELRRIEETILKVSIEYLSLESEGFNLPSCSSTEIKFEPQYTGKNNHIVQFLAFTPEFDLNSYDSKGKTMLHYASTNGDVSIVKLLLDHQASVSHQTPKSRTPLHCATKHNHLEIVKLLIEHNSDLTIEAKTFSFQFMLPSVKTT